MARRFAVDSINLEICDINAFVNERGSGIVISWDSDIGFGEYTIYKRAGEKEWRCSSEHMDNNSDKAFLKELLKLFVEKLDIVD
jgi:hypothetical protein